MYKRTRVVSATVMAVLGGSLLAFNILGGSQLEAAMIAETGINWARVIVWTSVGLLVISALMFISASAE